jgi:hypothetical protein
MSTPMREISADQSSPAPGHQVAQPPDQSTDARPRDAGGKAGVFESHRWLIPASGIASIVAAFVMMILLTWFAGGNTPFHG